VASDHRYFVYTMASVGRALYVGVTNDLERRVYQHKHGLLPGFTSQYRVTRLVFYEETSDVHAALAREKQIKSWRREKKIALIEASNPDWRDLAADWFDAPPAPPFRAGPPTMSSRGAERRGISAGLRTTGAAGNRGGRDSSPASGGLGMT